jgi:nitrogen fixation protein NifB
MGGCFQAKIDPRYEHLVKKHPCFSGEAHFKNGRIHLPVSPYCNIQCKFCKRSLNKYENRPGVTGSILSPQDAVEMVEKALKLCPEITVVGIAGPGDTLATPHALDTFELIHKRYPDLIMCLSTNGLVLKEKAQRIADVGVKTITVTVNAIDPDILEKICSYVVFNGIHLIGREAALLLPKAQLEGIKAIHNLGVIVKINVVLIPGVNDKHIEEIARATAEAGASLINIIPLIPQNEMENYNAPDCSELNAARESAEKYLPVFRHCQHCRADACGIPGSGLSFEGLLYKEPLQTFSHG